MFFIRGLFLCCFMFFCARAVSNDIERDLGKVNVFSMGFNGFFAKKMPQQEVYERALNSKDAVKIFEKVLSESSSTPESKLYALCGLREKNVINLIVTSKNDDFFKVNYMKADVITRRGYNELVESITKNGCH